MGQRPAWSEDSPAVCHAPDAHSVVQLSDPQRPLRRSFPTLTPRRDAWAADRATPTRRGEFHHVCGRRHGDCLLPRLVFARLGSIAQSRSNKLLSRRSILCSRRLPGRHDVGDRLGGFRKHLRGRGVWGSCLLRRKAFVPGCRANVMIHTPRPVFLRTNQASMHNIDGPGSRRPRTSADRKCLPPFSRCGSVALEASEHVVSVVHLGPVEFTERDLYSMAVSWGGNNSFHPTSFDGRMIY